MRDPFAEQLAKVLTKHGNTFDEKIACSVGQTLPMQLARLELPRTRVNPLPKWRLRRVEEYVAAHLDCSIGLSDLAKVAGLSRMHFAAQFRAATGYRPRAYLLHRRIEYAKSLLSNTEMPLTEVALTLNRKSALFAGSDGGGDNWAVIATLIENCKLSSVEPYAYLADVLTRIVNGHLNRAIDELLPWAFSAAEPLKAVA